MEEYNEKKRSTNTNWWNSLYRKTSCMDMYSDDILYLLWINKTLFLSAESAAGIFFQTGESIEMTRKLLASIEWIDDWIMHHLINEISINHQSNEFAKMKYALSNIDTQEQQKNEKNDAIVGFWCIKYLNNTLKIRGSKCEFFIRLKFDWTHCFYYIRHANDTIWLNRTHRKNYFIHPIASRIMMMRDLVDYIFNFKTFAFVRQQKNQQYWSNKWFLISEPTLIFSDSIVVIFFHERKKNSIVNRHESHFRRLFKTVSIHCLLM